ncbi:MAG: hypothetical protein H7Y01_02140 [Ferruginibacter sp.]|nr:hypothetical protein [Chitinophagaceae bacterium]
MTNSSRNLLVLFKTGQRDEKAIEQEMECLNEILRATESADQFCTAYELVDRNRITFKKKKIIKESAYFPLRPFRFLINKN